MLIKEYFNRCKVFFIKEWFKLSLVLILSLYIFSNLIFIPTLRHYKFEKCMQKVSNWYYYGINVKQNEEYIGGENSAEKRLNYCIKKSKI